MLGMLLIKGRRECRLTTLLTPPPEGRRSPYETHHSVVGHHGSDRVGGKRGGTGDGDRLGAGGKQGRWAGRVHPEGRKRCRSGRHYRCEGSPPRGRNNPQERDKREWHGGYGKSDLGQRPLWPHPGLWRGRGLDGSVLRRIGETPEQLRHRQPLWAQQAGHLLGRVWLG